MELYDAKINKKANSSNFKAAKKYYKHLQIKKDIRQELFFSEMDEENRKMKMKEVDEADNKVKSALREVNSVYKTKFIRKSPRNQRNWFIPSNHLP